MYIKKEENLVSRIYENEWNTRAIITCCVYVFKELIRV